MGVLAWRDAVDIGGGRGRLARDAAASLARVDIAMRSAFGRAADINEAWRSPEAADENYRKYLAYLRGGPWAPIALPGDKSVHCFGYALDTDDTSDAHMRIWNDHGWFWTVYRNGKLAERWHLEYFANRDNHRHEGAPASSKNEEPEPAPQPSEEDDMTEILSSPLGQSVHMGGIIVNFGSPDEVRAFKTEQGQPIRIVAMSATTHADLIAKANRRDVQRSNLPIIVREQGGQSIYVMTDGRISWLSDVTTVQNLIDQGALTVYWPKGEIENLIAQQKA